MTFTPSGNGIIYDTQMKDTREQAEYLRGYKEGFAEGFLVAQATKTIKSKCCKDGGTCSCKEPTLLME